MSREREVVVLGVAALVAGVVSAQPLGGWRVWDVDLNESRGRLVAVGLGGVVVEDADGFRREVAFDRVAAIVDAEHEYWGREGDVLPMVKIGETLPVVMGLVDGQVWRGQLSTTESADPERVRVVLPQVGVAELDLEDMLWVDFEGSARHEKGDSRSDAVRLRNGDVIEGFVAGVGSLIEIEVDGRTIELPADGVGRVELANREVDAGGVRVWMNESRVLAGRSVSGDGWTDLALEVQTPGGETVGSLPLWEPGRESFFVGIERLPARMKAWSELELVRFEVGGGRRWSGRPEAIGPRRMGVSTIVISGAMDASWRLPSRARRARAEVGLGEGAGPWAEAKVRVVQGGRVLWETELGAEKRSDSFVVELGREREIEVEVGSGRFGPIENEVEIRWGWILLDEAEAGR